MLKPDDIKFGNVYSSESGEERLVTSVTSRSIWPRWVKKAKSLRAVLRCLSSEFPRMRMQIHLFAVSVPMTNLT